VLFFSCSSTIVDGVAGMALATKALLQVELLGHAGWRLPRPAMRDDQASRCQRLPASAPDLKRWKERVPPMPASLYVRIIIHGPMDVTSPPDFL
jgi:Ser/Thr protein kinase RdoA (MazF antagonist)